MLEMAFPVAASSVIPLWLLHVAPYQALRVRAVETAAPYVTYRCGEPARDVGATCAGQVKSAVPVVKRRRDHYARK